MITSNLPPVIVSSRCRRTKSFKASVLLWLFRILWVSHGHRLEVERRGCGRSSGSIRWSGPMPRFPFLGSRTRCRASRGQRMQDVDGPAEIQALPQVTVVQSNHAVLHADSAVSIPLFGLDVGHPI